MKNLYNSFLNHPFYLMLDETTDRNQKNILNVLIGKLGTMKYKKPLLLYSSEVCNTKCKTILSQLKAILKPIFKYNFNSNNFKVFLTDGASYCRKLGKVSLLSYNLCLP